MNKYESKHKILNGYRDCSRESYKKRNALKWLQTENNIEKTIPDVFTHIEIEFKWTEKYEIDEKVLEACCQVFTIYITNILC